MTSSRKDASGLGDLEMRVLLAVLHCGEDAYGVTVVREIESRTGKELPREGECYDGSSGMRMVQTVLAIAAGGLGILALIPAFAFAFRNIWLRRWVMMVGAAVALVAIYAIVGRL